MTQAQIPIASQKPEQASAQQAAPQSVAAIVPTSSEEPSRALSAFSSESAFNAGLRMAKALAASSLVPAQYQNNVPNVLIAMELANRIGASVFMVMQNLDIIHGQPGWRAKFLIATVNASGRFTPLRFRFQGKPGTDEWGCRAVARDRRDGEECVGPLVTIGIAKAEGWFSRKGSKWPTMPELMLVYRAAALWTRVYAPELSLGMQTADEVVDTLGVDVPEQDLPAPIVPGSAQALEAALRAQDSPQPSPQETPVPLADVTQEREPGEEG